MPIHQITDREEFNLNRSMRSNQDIQIGTYLKDLTNYTEQVSAGVFTKPTMTDNLDGTVTIGDGEYLLYSGSGFVFPLDKYNLSGSTVTLTDNSTNYVTVQYNSASPIIVSSTNRDNITQSDVIPIVTIYRSGSSLHILDWDELGRGLANKVSDRLVRTERFAPETGALIIGEKSTRYITATGGHVWYGASRQVIDSYDSSVDDLQFYYHSSGSWVSSFTPQFNNLQYDDGLNLQSLLPSRYAVIWVFRAICNEKHAYYVLGNGNYKLIEAQSSGVPALPNEISSQGLLIGRIIIEQGASAATEVSSAFATQFTKGSVLHNDLSGIQGGTTDQYYHLTSLEHGSASTLASGSVVNCHVSGSFIGTAISASAKFGTGDNYTYFEEDGTMGMSGSATTWEDLRFPATAINPVGAPSPMGFDTTYIGFTAAAGQTQTIAVIAQMPHSWKLGSTIYPHVHWMPTSTNSGSVLWNIQYKWTDLNQVESASFISLNVSQNASGSAYTHQLVGWAVSGSSIYGLSSLLTILVSRIGGSDSYTGDALLKEFDIHYQIDSVGSREPMSK